MLAAAPTRDMGSLPVLARKVQAGRARCCVRLSSHSPTHPPTHPPTHSPHPSPPAPRPRVAAGIQRVCTGGLVPVRPVAGAGRIRGSAAHPAQRHSAAPQPHRRLRGGGAGVGAGRPTVRLHGAAASHASVWRGREWLGSPSLQCFPPSTHARVDTKACTCVPAHVLARVCLELYASQLARTRAHAHTHSRAHAHTHPRTLPPHLQG